MDDERFSLQDAAGALGISTEAAFRMFTNGLNDMCPLLKPSVWFEEPVELGDVSHLGDEAISCEVDVFPEASEFVSLGGLFQVGNFSSRLPGMLDGNGYLNLRGVPLLKQGRVYQVTTPKHLRKEELIVSSVDLSAFKAAHGITGPVVKSPQLDGNVSDQIRSLVATMRARGVAERGIANEIDLRFPGLTDAKMGGFFTDPNVVTHDGLRRRGQRVRGKVK
ncbi:hypothetical protein GMST_32840 [Geomonas silvestris]|uniref:Uncharacterized protein n=1 Tax=Geomonas silvestris TaxID=2740184 RepID=A0A6V8MMS6_9BACT|nr:hypothetical protein [Geomonas silvestris]GFO60959.1 hypothetical protein GMST_32840 [Geomonas silvestris]